MPSVSVLGSLPSYAVDESYRFFGGSTRKRLYKTRGLGLNSFIQLEQSLLTGGKFNVRANLTAGEDRYPDTDPTAPLGSFLEERSRRGYFDFTLEQPLLKPSQPRNDLANREDDLEIARLTRLQDETALRREVTEAFLGLLIADTKEQTAADRLEAAGLRAEIDSTKWNDGVLSEEEWLTSASRAPRRGAGLREASLAAAERRRDLALLLDLADSDEVQPVEPAAPEHPEPARIEQWRSDWENSREVRRAAYVHAKAKRAAGFAAAGHGLTGDFHANYTFGRGNVKIEGENEDRINTNGWGVSLNFTYPVWDGGASGRRRARGPLRGGSRAARAGEGEADRARRDPPAARPTRGEPPAAGDPEPADRPGRRPAGDRHRALHGRPHQPPESARRQGRAVRRAGPVSRRTESLRGEPDRTLGPVRGVTVDERPFPFEEIEGRIRNLFAPAGEGPNDEILESIVRTGARLAWDDVSRLDLKIVNAALRELRRSFRVFAPFRGVPKVSVFGSARTPVEHPLYRSAELTAALFVQHGMMIITGAGGGVMEAANRGAGLEGGFGLAIRLPFEPETNPWVLPERLINFKYFFTRKLIFIKESAGFVLFPGGFGTNDEAFELLTLLQTGKAEPRPVVLLDLDAGTYWESWLDFCRRELAGHGYIDADDLNLLTLAHRPEEALAAIRRFYRLFHSSRYVGDRLMFRLRRPLTAAEIARLNEQFADIIKEALAPCPPPTEDQFEPSLQPLHRVWFRFDKRGNARLRRMIDAINEMEES